MSATGRSPRGGVVDGATADYFPTPAWCVHRLLDDCADDLGLVDGADVTALEPTVGDGAIVRAVASWPLLRPSHALPRWTGVELRRGALDPATRLDRHVEGVDFRSWHPDPDGIENVPLFDVTIGNPPFNLAESIVRHAMDISVVVVMLLRVSFLESDERIPFWHGVGEDPALRILPNRPSFDGEGTDSTAYAWFIWGCPAITGVRVLASTPAGVRAAQRPGPIVIDPIQRSLFEAAE